MSILSSSLLGVLLAGAFAAGSPSAAPRTITIGENTQGNYGELYVGVSYVRRGEYADETGAKKKGLTAGLRLHIASKPPQGKRLKAHAGLRVDFAGYSFLVEEIKGGMKGAVRLTFDEKKESPPKRK